MTWYINRLQQEHQRLDRLIDDGRNVLGQSELTLLKRLRLQLKDRLAQLQRQPALSTP